MKFDIITIFPDAFDSYLSQSLLGKAQEKDLIEVNVHDLRGWTSEKKGVDDEPYGGGRGMVMKVGPIYGAVKDVKEENGKVVLFTPRGEEFDQRRASSFSDLDQLVMICGRYEGVDERVAKHIADLELSIGNYVLMGGELAALVVMEATSRLIPGVVQKPEEFQERISEDKGFIEYPQYTRPEVFETETGEEWEVPSVLLSGDHQKVKEWREKHQEIVE
ncbi:tRNA (guanine-N1)-methyltransferase [candidate division MSBL1 archaeon SCGC-AAA382N08]|uniref:tRNA (guanine-N(1)-)-methyltransferase n=1 Tax=candidate division MSBL1 archaeon SCGC-AAA382N08 TaxID=1698285 RepID=A0A133VPR5_9EURY|nr:tRNA (guanine-N1)-methyltransferase [candidate division MSBL1 archaeon SCGC-AAA382N08]